MFCGSALDLIILLCVVEYVLVNCRAAWVASVNLGMNFVNTSKRDPSVDTSDFLPVHMLHQCRTTCLPTSA